MGLSDKGRILAANLDPDLGEKKCLEILEEADRFLKIYEDYLVHAKKIKRTSPAFCRWERVSRKNDKGDSIWVRLVKSPKMSPNKFRQIEKDFFQSQFVFDGKTLQKNQKPVEKILIISTDEDAQLLCLSQSPKEGFISILPQTYTLEKQIVAINALLNNPKKDYLPIIKLLIDLEKTTDTWPKFPIRDIPNSEFIILNKQKFTQSKYEGTESQKKCVSIAHSSPDFTFLEGPPGSGKTETICEIILQAAKKDLKVLLIAPSHTAVDNVLEKLKEYDSKIIAVRISAREIKVDEKVIGYHINNRRETEKTKLIEYINNFDSGNPSESQDYFREALESNNEIATDIVLKSADLVCGTNIGILYHPAIKMMGENISPIYDLMIIDESSRSTFQEWLVPALFAKKWIIVGDTLQLPPFVDQNDYASNIEEKLTQLCKTTKGFPSSDNVKEVCLDVFNVFKSRLSGIVIDSQRNNFNLYREQAKSLDVPLCDLESIDVNSKNVPFSGKKMYLCTPDSLEKFADNLPIDVCFIRGVYDSPRFKNRLETRYTSEKAFAEIKSGNNWGVQIAWRLDLAFQLRKYAELDGPCYQIKKSYLDDFECLLPQWDSEAFEKIQSEVGALGIAPLPSIIEVLQNGFGSASNKYKNSIISGMDCEAFKHRHILLEYQHRMDEEISKFPREMIYKINNKNCLLDPPYLVQKRKKEFHCPAYNNNRSVWVTGPFLQSEEEKSEYKNVAEADELIKHLASMVKWAKNNGKIPDNAKQWEIAVLTFYSGQEDLLREKIKSQFGIEGNRLFELDKKITLRLSTVDGFQGHEAHIVFISLVMSTKIGFLKIPQRLNVGLTRARNLNVVFGLKKFFETQTESTLLKTLAETEKYFMVVDANTTSLRTK